RAQLEANTDPLTLRRALQRRDLRLRPAHRQGGLAVVSRDDHLPMAHGNGEKRPRPLAVGTPDPLDVGRVGRPVVKGQDHTAASLGPGAARVERLLTSRVASGGHAGAASSLVVIGHRLPYGPAPGKAPAPDAASVSSVLEIALVAQAVEALPVL